MKRVQSRLAGLEVETREKALLLLAIASDQGYAIRVTQGLRSLAEQEALYVQGRESREKVNAMRRFAGMPHLGPLERNRIVTNAKPGYSWHNFGRAFDIVPMRRADRLMPVWASPFWRAIGEIGKQVGLEWGGDWTKPDRPHFQNRRGKTLKEVRQDFGVPDDI